MNTPRHEGRQTLVFWIAAVAAAVAALAAVQADRGVPPDGASPAAEMSVPPPEAPSEPTAAELDEQFSIFSEHGIHAGVMAF